ncbi:ATP-dependent zinc metalloprotease FtsH [Rhodohalobacter sp. WB101]|uniref:ATP-dependent zinc metalloprotease FtsH n=2 Tax=Rhodohalobacter sulfatireducens TaxID=2911366 RepID=A0ABS9KG61_9BACT|nr:ATP-dependent zinc metalloprotease FtsH [Rhodohalobacter sulfatireducens]MCG2589820.1 ATP-dependent zinc metalloprotease FtsH [Rhodohalobacter sulfatireducens]
MNQDQRKKSNNDHSSGSNQEDDPRSSKEKDKRKRPGNYPSWMNILLWILIFAFIFTWIQSPGGGIFSQSSEVSYSEFRQQLQNGNVESIHVQGEQIRGVLKNPQPVQTSQDDTTSYENFITYIPSFGDESLFELLEEQEVSVSSEPVSDFNWWSILLFGIPILLFIYLGFMFYQRFRAQGQGIFNIGKSKAKLQEPEKQDTSFDDVAGLDNTKKELEEVIEFLKDPTRFEEIGAKLPKGLLMVGPPGTGKTLLARAVAGEAEVPFYSISGSDFMEMFVGVGAKRIRDMFNKAKEKSPSIIFIDEIDSIGRSRGAGLGGGHDEREQTLNQLLSELDGFEPNESVVVIAATNRPDILDKALLRPGRFDRRITVDMPNQQAREKILEIHAKNKPMADDVDLGRVAKSTPGFSGADLENLLNEASLYAGRDKRKQVTMSDIDKARDKVMMGLEREGVQIDEEEKKMLAYHEAGHALVAAVLPHSDPIHKVTIIPRGKAMGVTQQFPEKEKYIYKREYLLDRLAVIMGGRAAEDLVFQTSTSGAQDDLKQVAKLSRRMVLQWGMSDRFQHISLGSDEQEVFLGRDMSRKRKYSDSTAREIDEEVQKISDEAFDRALNTLKEKRDVLDEVAQLLLEKEEISGEEVDELLK